MSATRSAITLSFYHPFRRANGFLLVVCFCLSVDHEDLRYFERLKLVPAVFCKPCQTVSDRGVWHEREHRNSLKSRSEPADTSREPKNTCTSRFVVQMTWWEARTDYSPKLNEYVRSCGTCRRTGFAKYRREQKKRVKVPKIFMVNGQASQEGR